MPKRGISALMEGFNDGYDMAGRVIKDYQMGQVANAKEETSQEYTDDQRKSFEAIAGTKNADGSDAYRVNKDDNGNYTVTAIGAGEGGTDVTGGPIERRSVTRYLGKTYDGPLTDTQRNSARLSAMAGIYEKSGDPEKAMMLRAQGQQLEQNERQGKLTDLQIGQAERSGRREDKADALTAQLEEIDKDVGDWLGKRLTNPDGTQRAMTTDDHLDMGQYRASRLVAAGRLNEANALAKDNMQMAASKIQLQTAERNEALATVGAAVAAGDLSKLGAFYDKFVPDGAKVKNVTQDPKTGAISIERETVDGRAVPAVTFKHRNELLAGLQTFKDPMALYNFSQSEFHRLLQTRADKRADAQLAVSQAAGNRAQAEFDAGGPERNLKSTLATLQLSLGNTDDPKQREAIQEKINAIQTGVGVGKEQPAEVKLAQAMVKAGMYPDMRTALEVAITKKGQSADEIHQGFVQAGIKNMMPADQSVAKADEAMAAMGYAKKNGRWSQAGSGAAAAAGGTGPAKGTVVNGYEFQGGDPNDKKNWRSVSGGKVN